MSNLNLALMLTPIALLVGYIRQFAIFVMFPPAITAQVADLLTTVGLLCTVAAIVFAAAHIHDGWRAERRSRTATVGE